MFKMRVPFSKPDLTRAEADAVAYVVNSGQLSLGQFVPRFERALARFVGAQGGAAVSSGTAGLHLALLGLGLKPGQHVITTPLSFVASANVILHSGAVPVFVDVERDTGNISPDEIRFLIDQNYQQDDNGNLIHKKTRARLWGILPVHLFGYPCKMDEISDIATEFNLKVVEDACEALGSTFYSANLKKWVHPGALSDAAVFAFYPNKQITTGEGGMVLSNSLELMSRIKCLRNQGRREEDKWLVHEEIGYNYRMDEMSAVLGLMQMRRIETMRAKRQKVAERYDSLLSDIDELELPPWQEWSRVNPFVYAVRLLVPGRDSLMDYLASVGIDTRPYFTPIHLQPAFRRAFGFGPGRFPVAEELGSITVALPFHNNLKESEMQYVVNHIKRWLVLRERIYTRRRESEQAEEVAETHHG